ncbi:hypothetical protein [Candidatus Enterococcus mansonii]|uniref:MucBP domain-containing protein n=1 Tax=Candidatus Enterococcus mansonii TaxID=1834181 RepID=A0A242CCD9_9ENTE|nr:hypothetical protein [Enterococcus sp. 4G2_DIV0659]OTO07829.1 hypothetical protein A5880_002099 [Enterococcus sp. 4G2_DIV0659]
MNKGKGLALLLGCLVISSLVYKQVNFSLIKAEKTTSNQITMDEKQPATNSTHEVVQGPENRAVSSKRKDTFLDLLESDKWRREPDDGEPEEMFRRKQSFMARSEAKELDVTGAFGGNLFDQFVRIGNPSGNPGDTQYYLGSEMKPNLQMFYQGIGNQSNLFGILEESSVGWTKDSLLNSSPVILSQTDASGTKVIDALSINGHGNLADTTNQPSLIENIRFYGIRDEFSLLYYTTYSKMVYEIRNNPAVRSANMFDYHLRVESISGVDPNGATIVGTRVTNIGAKSLPGLSLGGKYHVEPQKVTTSGGGENIPQSKPVTFLDSNRGLIFTTSTLDPKHEIKVRFYFDTPSKPKSWSVGQLNDGGHLEQFYDARYSGFTGPASPGQEKNNAGFDAVAYSNEIRQANGIKEPYKTAVYVKNDPADLAPGESTLYSYRVLSSLLISETPEIALDEDESSYFGGSHTITGTTMHYNDKSKNIEILYALNPDGPFTSGTIVKNDTPGSDIPWSVVIPQSALKLQDQKVYLKAVAKDLGNKESDILFQNVVYNTPPVITIPNPNNWYFNGSSYTFSGTWSEAERETVSLYYSLDGGLPEAIAKNLPNPGGNQPFTKEISAAKLGNESHTISVWAEDARGGLSKEVTWTIGPHTMPELSASLAIDKTEIDEGQSVLFTSTFKNSAAEPSVWDQVVYETTEVFPENVEVDTASVTLNNQKVTGKVTFANGKLSVELGKVDPGIEMQLTYTVVSKIGTPPISAPIKVDQAYKVSGITADATKKEQTSGAVKSFTINPRIASVEILYLEVGTNEALKTGASLSGQIGDLTDPIQLELIEGYELTQVFFDDKEQLPLPTAPFKVNYGTVKQVKFYYEGRLRFKTVPDSFDFGIQAGFIESKRFKPQIKGQNLIISDTRREKQGWSLKAKITDPLKNAEGVLMTDVIKYNNGGKEELVLNETDMVIYQHKDTTKHEYDLTKENWLKNDEGFILDVKAGGLKALGKYHAELELTLEDAK